MTYEKIKDLSPENFKRLCGVRKETVAQMVQILEKQLGAKIKSGRTSKLNQSHRRVRCICQLY